VTVAKRPKDLYVLVADQDMLQTMEHLLRRGPSLEVRSIEYAIAKHLHRDPGCRSNAAQYLRRHSHQYKYALVMFDKHGCGDKNSREEIQRDVEDELFRNGWRDRSKVIVIDPELETWIWTASNRMPQVLGWQHGGYVGMKRWLASKGLWENNSAKPAEPKRALRAVLKEIGRRSSSSLFGKLAASVTLHGCEDPAFIELRDTLVHWFPNTEDG